jgi:hypothetical protein
MQTSLPIEIRTNQYQANKGLNPCQQDRAAPGGIAVYQ